MKNLSSTCLIYKNNTLLVLDQQQLPQKEEWIACQSPTHMIDIIKKLQIRGAPAIGVAAVLALADFAEKGANSSEFEVSAEALKNARPTAINLKNCVDRQLKSLDKNHYPQSVVEMAEKIFEEDAALCDAMARHGEKLIHDGDTILTHCNTGGLVTTGIGTALGVVIHAHNNNKKIHVCIDETRPLLQGARLTAWELAKNNIPHTLNCDNMAASLMQKNKIQAIFLGADRIAKNGDFANKIGTYNLAVLAKYHGVPFYVVAPYTTIDFHCETGKDIPIEEREADEVRGAKGAFGAVIWSMNNTPIYNPAFDVTPAALVTAYVLDRGVMSSDEIKNIHF
ncbi:MAG: hypothetical protein ACD_42C00440G0002 [uncultured bacterium]|nr:MAG: hypothetical protein ACD_42C00440G0002 [uncultured bacterium]OGT34297.1 MAG: S-methyl-5-thioribose-1-phosphate isomerase [Gammaproteobacteria bacterium RIFCSPHIGHO2_02_FULL_39_13]OGT48947.1 MAG: S-methyl-5-thioribose-1-phosphate isomerase [Gammaproteobacteria bacterium RIFCSPHIGHO2_12_FULL_39_24]